MATILVIEDNTLNMKLTRILLADKNYHVLEAYDAEQGLKLAASYRPDLILMDIQLPGMDGIQAIQRLKGSPEQTNTPVIALTALAMDGDEQRMLACGFDDYISKPINAGQLYRKIQAQLEISCAKGGSNANQ